MPIYAYRCEACGHAKDVLQRVSDALLTTCPACGAEAFRKQVTAAGFQLKGSGWYVTDFKGNGQAKPPSDAKGESAKGDGASGEKGEKGDSKAATTGAAPSPDSAPTAPAPKIEKAADKAVAKPAASAPPSPSSGSTPA